VSLLNTTATEAVVAYHNYPRYHYALGNITRADVFQGKREQVLQSIKESQIQTIERRSLYNKAVRKFTPHSSHR